MNYFSTLNWDLEALEMFAMSRMMPCLLRIMQTKIICPPCKHFNTEIVFIMMKQVGHSFR